MLAIKERDENIELKKNSSGKVETRSGSKLAEIINVKLENLDGKGCKTFVVGQEAVVKCTVQVNSHMNDITVGMLIRDRLGNDIYGTNTCNLNLPVQIEKGKRAVVDFRFAVNLGPGSYSVTIALHQDKSHIQGNYDWWDNVLVFQVLPVGQSAEFIGVSYLPVKASMTL